VHTVEHVEHFSTSGVIVRGVRMMTAAAAADTHAFVRLCRRLALALAHARLSLALARAHLPLDHARLAGVTQSRHCVVLDAWA
jgi:hypothetical protein